MIQKARGKLSKAHPFLPYALQSPMFLTWLRRGHGWLGAWGALAGILFGLTTIMMVHGEVFRTAESVQNIIQLPVGEAAISSVDETGAFVKTQLELTTMWRTPRNQGAAAGMGAGIPAGKGTRQPTYVTQFTSPGTTLDVRYVRGNEYIEITRTERGFLEVLNRLHRGNGAQLGWTLLGDAFSGALVVLAMTGVLLWSKMDGSRLLAVSLGGAGFLVVLYFGLAGA